MRVLLAAIIIGLLSTPSLVLAQIKQPDVKDIIKPKMPDPMSEKDTKPEPISENTPISGKTIHEWIKEMFTDDPSRSQRAIQMTLAFGPDLSQKAVPSLLYLIERHKQIDRSVRVNVIIVLGEILAEDNNPDPNHVKKLVPFFNKLLLDDDPLIRYKTAEAIGKLGPAAVATVPHLMKTLAEEIYSWEVRQACVQSLGKVAYDEKYGPPKAVLHALYGRLQTTGIKAEKAAQVRLAAIQAFTWLGPPKGDATEQKAVYDALALAGAQDPEPMIRIWSSLALMSIKGEPDSKKVAAIGGFLKHKDIEVRVQAAQALFALGLDAKSEVPHLIDALDDKEKSVAAWAMIALTRMGRFADTNEPVYKKLQEISKSKDWPPGLQQAAENLLKQLRGELVSTNQKDQEKE
jgi:HEAT repeat protein